MVDCIILHSLMLLDLLFFLPDSAYQCLPPGFLSLHFHFLSFSLGAFMENGAGNE